MVHTLRALGAPRRVPRPSAKAGPRSLPNRGQCRATCAGGESDWVWSGSPSALGDGHVCGGQGGRAPVLTREFQLLEAICRAPAFCLDFSVSPIWRISACPVKVFSVTPWGKPGVGAQFANSGFVWRLIRRPRHGVNLCSEGEVAVTAHPVPCMAPSVHGVGTASRPHAAAFTRELLRFITPHFTVTCLLIF